MQALKQRRTIRDLKPDKLPAQVLANLLWAGFGINRPESGHRTAPSAMNSQEVDLYVALPEGLYLYEAKPHQLQPVLAKDLRAKTSGQPFATNAPVVLIYVADLPRLTKRKTRNSASSTPALIPAASARISTCTALPRVWRRWCMIWTARRSPPR